MRQKHSSKVAKDKKEGDEGEKHLRAILTRERVELFLGGIRSRSKKSEDEIVSQRSSQAWDDE